MRRYSQMMDANLTAAQVAVAAERAGQAGSEFRRAALAELRWLLEKRISDLRWKRAAALLAGMLALALAALIVTLIARNITGPLAEVVKLAADIAAGRVKEGRERLKRSAVSQMLAERVKR
jgi:hypothetical protein